MKEYIPLEWFEDFLVGENLAWDGRDIPTVTKADIYFEILKETCPHKHSDMCGDWFGGECCMNNCHLLKKAYIDTKTVTKADIRAEVVDEFVALCDEAKICETYYCVSMDAIRNIAKILKECKE